MNLPRPPELADAKTLSETAQKIASIEKEKATSNQPVNALFRFEQTIAHESIVDFTFIVPNAATGRNIAANAVQLRGIAEGSACSAYRDDLQRGVLLHYVFKLADGTPVIHFTFDRASC